ncbi:MAG: family 20 glycosylhydrolase [Planctomycetes bacterium]|nr:family 20 glycosylhydrolase [Planctomycetota bacterium]
MFACHAALISFAAIFAQAVPQNPVEKSPAIIPRPAQLDSRHGVMPISGDVAIRITKDDPESTNIAVQLAAWLKPLGVAASVGKQLDSEQAEDRIVLSVDPALRGFAEEEYLLDIGDEITIKARTGTGLFWGAQSLRQLMEQVGESRGGRFAEINLLKVVIRDKPRFAHRGMLLDCGRHFMPVDFVKRYIDLLAYHKMNVLHWHLTEDQGWRIEIKKYPKLTEIGAWRTAQRDSEQPRDAMGRYGGYYTQDQIRDIVTHAKSRHITVIPEIEMPGHALAALAAYPELSCKGTPLEVWTEWGVIDDVYCAGNDKVFDFLEDVLSEVIELFPSTYIHIGGDECPKSRWEKCPKCQARMKARNMKNEQELQSYFIHRIEKFLNGKGRRLIGWDEILEGGLAPNATVQSWRGMNGAIAAATSGHDVIASPTSHCYLDYAQCEPPDLPILSGYLPLETVYSFDPMPESLTPAQMRHIRGIEGNIWSERAPPERVDWQVFPRLCAIAEIGWSPRDARDWNDFQRRMEAHYGRFDAMGVTYFIPSPKLAVPVAPFAEKANIAFEDPFRGGEIRYTTDGSDPTQRSARYDKPFELNASATVKARTYLPGGRCSPVAEWKFTKS